MTQPVSPVHWRPDGTPYSERFNDIYRTHGMDGRGGLAQARHVFLGGCGLPEAWRGKASWTVLETGFGLGLNFLATWQAWRDDPHAPAHLHYVAIEAWPPTAADVLRSAVEFPELKPWAEALSARWQGLLPGLHRLNFENERIRLTLCVGDVQAMLREQHFAADSLFLDGFNPANNPDMWNVHTLKAVSRLCRHGTRVATWTVAASVRNALTQTGFVVEKVQGLPPKRESLCGQWSPTWKPRHLAHLPSPPSPEQRAALVVGAGLAGASTAFSLAQRGWQVTVLDQAVSPAAGASGLPVGLIAPHVSGDDRPLSRLTRSGVIATLERAQALLRDGCDWQPSGVMELRIKTGRNLPPDWLNSGSPGEAWSRPATTDQLQQAGLRADISAHWHVRAGWVRPAALVRAMLSLPGITWRGGQAVARLQPRCGSWHALDALGRSVAEARLVVIAAGYNSMALLQPMDSPPLPLHALRGQIAWGPADRDVTPLPPFPVNGQGSLISGFDLEGHRAWIFGSTFERDCADAVVRPEDTMANFNKLTTLLPDVANALRTQFETGQTHAWAAVRCTVPDRLPVVGALSLPDQPGLYVCTAMGARGITLGVLCGELLAAQIMGEPLPVPLSQARALAPLRWSKREPTTPSMTS